MLSIIRPKMFTARWYEKQMRDALSYAGLSRSDTKIAKKYIKKAALRAEDAFELGRADAAANIPKRNMEGMLNNQENLKNYPFKSVIASAYSSGYDTRKGGI